MRDASPSKRFSPILDETAIVATLSMPVNPQSANEYLRTASYMAVVDAHDRQLLRPAFVQMSDRAFKLNEYLRMLECAARFLIDLKNPDLSRETLIASVETLAAEKMDQANEVRAMLLADMKLTIECAWENDIVN